jgi:peptide/nickel transport system permease protein
MRFASLVGARVVQAIPVLLGITLVTFLMLQLLPGDSARTIGGLRATPEILAAIRERLGTDQPLVVQYLNYMGQLVQGDLGRSDLLGQDINALISARLPATVFLVLYAGALAILIGVPLALLSAVRRNRAPDLATRAVLVVALGLPSFWIGLLLVAYPALKWGWFPSGGYGESLADHIYHLLLPALTLSITFLAVLVRSLRASLIDVLAAQYVDLARLKGITTARVYSRHILRNALRPALTIVGLNMSFLLGASVIVESVFAIDGIGNTLIQAILQRDFLVVQGIALVFGILVLLVTLIVDVLQSMLDPRQTA